LLSTSLSILHGRKASHLAFCTVGKLLTSFTVGITVSGLSVEVGLSLLGLYLKGGKPLLVTSRSRSGLLSSQQLLQWPVCRLWLASSQSFFHPPPGSVRLYRTTTLLSLAGTLLLPMGWHPTAAYWLAFPLPGGSPRPSILPDRRTPPQLRPVVVLPCLRGCRQRLGSTDVITGATYVFSSVSPQVQWFPHMQSHTIPFPEP